MFPPRQLSQKGAASSIVESATTANGSTSSSSSSSSQRSRSSTSSLETALHLLRQERKQIRKGANVGAYAYAGRQLIAAPAKSAQSSKTARKKVKAKTVRRASKENDELDGQEADLTGVQDDSIVVEADIKTEDSTKVEDDELDADGEEDPGVEALDVLLEAAAAQEKQKSNDEDDQQDETPKQNVAVCVRLRPADKTDEVEMWKCDVDMNRIMPTEHHPTMVKRNTTATASGEMASVSEDGAYSFKFDSLVQPSQAAGDMYDQQISPIVNAVAKGYNGTVFAYGQTGSGKTHTMSGGSSKDNEVGVIPRAIRQIFDDVEKMTKREFLIRVSYLEIYNETLNDLLAALPSLSSVGGSEVDAEGRPSSPIKGGSSHTVVGTSATGGSTLKMFEAGGRVQIQGLREEIVTQPEEVLDLLERGQKARHQAATDWNERSSRSHCVFILTVESREKAASTSAGSSSSRSGVRLSQLNLIDLAGSERAASEKERRKEGAFINKSLLTLGTVIAKLSEQCATGKEEAHIPYRDSKLTRLLQTSLGGNARVAVICTVSPLKEHAVESLSTLRFGQRCKMVVTSAKQGSVVDDKALIARYRRELDKLRSQLEANQGASAATIPASSSSLARQDASVKALHDEKAKAEREVRDMNAQRATLKQQIEHLTRLILTGKEVEQGRISDVDEDEHDKGRRLRASRRSDLGTSSPSKLDVGRFQALNANGTSTPKGEKTFAFNLPQGSHAKPFAMEAELASMRKSVTKAMAAKQASEEARRREVQLWQAKVSELEEAHKEAEEELDEAEEAFNKLKEERDAMRKQVAEEREANRLLKLVAKSRTADLTDEQRRDILADSQRRIADLESKLAAKVKAEAQLTREIEKMRSKRGSDEQVEELKREIEDLRTQLSGNDNRSFATAADEESELATVREQLSRVEEEKSKLEQELRNVRIDQGQDEAERDFADLVGGDDSGDKIKRQLKDERKKCAELASLVEELKQNSKPAPPSKSSDDSFKLKRAEDKCKTLEQQVERLTRDLERSSFAQRIGNPSPPLSAAGSTSSGDFSPRMAEIKIENDEQKARIASLERQLSALEESSTLQAGPFRSSFASRVSRGGSVRQYRKYDSEAADLADTPTGPSSSSAALDVQRALKAEREEIERLNEVINSQRGIMTDLEASVATWKKRLRLQQEIIAKLVESGVKASPSLIEQSQTIAVADTPTMGLIARKADVNTPDLKRTPSTLSTASSGPYYGAHLYNKPPAPLSAAAHGLGLGSTSPTKGTAWLSTMPGHRPDVNLTSESVAHRSTHRNVPLPQPQSNARNFAAQDRRRTIEHEIASLKGSPRVESTKYRLLEPQMRSPTSSPAKIGRGPLPVVPGSPPKFRPTKDYYI